MEKHVIPYIGHLPIDRMGRDEIRFVLLPLHRDGKRVAKVVRQDIATVFEWAMEIGHCETNPAANGFKHTLPALPKARNQPALALGEAPGVFAEIEALPGEAADCLALVALTAVRAIEGACAEWSEIDWDSKTWTIPAERMKAKREHIVPLSDAVVRLLRGREGNGEAHIFPTVANRADPTRPLLDTMRKITSEATTHGWRATFRNWTVDEGVEFNLGEWCLAHELKDATAKAYVRSASGIKQRRGVMERWAAYLTG